MTALEAGAPARARDEVRALVARNGSPLVHTDFLALPDHLRAGDLLIVNASATIPAALPARRSDGIRATLHLSTPDATHPDRWVVELRRDGHRLRARSELLELPDGGTAELLAPFLSPGRLWVAKLNLPQPLHEYLHAHGRPITYAHDPVPRALDEYQTIFATEPGSAEMPSAGRPFTRRALERLREHGIRVQRITLHTGVSSQERDERPYPERFSVPEHTARRINATKAAGGRVIAVGTTVVRALETVAEPDGTVHGDRGWTSLVVTPERGVRVVDGLLTGWHEPNSTHRLLLEAIAGQPLIARSYAAATAHGYRRHEFGDLHLLAP